MSQSQHICMNKHIYMLERDVQMTTNFTYTMIHELKACLNGLRGNIFVRTVSCSEAIGINFLYDTESIHRQCSW